MPTSGSGSSTKSMLAVGAASGVAGGLSTAGGVTVSSCPADDKSFYCKFVRFFNMFKMILIILIVVAVIYFLLRYIVATKKKK